MADEETLRQIGLGINSPDPSTERSSEEPDGTKDISSPATSERNDDSSIADNSEISEEENPGPSIDEKLVHSPDSSVGKQDHGPLSKEQLKRRNSTSREINTEFSSKKKFACHPDVSSEQKYPKNSSRSVIVGKPGISSERKNAENPSRSVIVGHPGVSSKQKAAKTPSKSVIVVHPGVSSNQKNSENPSKSVIVSCPGTSSQKKKQQLSSEKLGCSYGQAHEGKNPKSAFEKNKNHPGPSSEKPKGHLCSQEAKVTQTKQFSKEQSTSEKSPEVITLISSDESSIECVGEFKSKDAGVESEATNVIQPNTPDNPAVRVNTPEVLEIPNSPEILEIPNSPEILEIQPNSSGSSGIRQNVTKPREMKQDSFLSKESQQSSSGSSQIGLNLPGTSTFQQGSQGASETEPELISLEDFRKIIHAVARNLQREILELREPDTLRPTFEEFWETLATRNIKPLSQEALESIEQALEEMEAKQKILDSGKPSTSRDKTDDLHRIKNWTRIAYKEIPPEEFHEALRVDKELEDLDYEEIFKTLDELLETLPKSSRSTSAVSSCKESSESSDDDLNKALASSKFQSKRRQILSSDSEESKLAKDDSSSDGDMNKVIASSGKKMKRCEIVSSDSEDSKAVHQSPVDIEQMTDFSSSRLKYSDTVHPKFSNEDVTGLHSSKIKTKNASLLSSDSDESKGTENSAGSKNITEEEYISSEHSNKSENVTTPENENSHTESRSLNSESKCEITDVKECSENSIESACLSDYSGKLSETEESKSTQGDEVTPSESNEKSVTENSGASPDGSEPSLDNTSKACSEIEGSESSNTSKSLNEPGFQSMYEDITPASSVHSVSSKKDSNDDQSSKGSNCSRSSVRDEVLSKSFRRTSLSDRSPSESATESVYEDVTYLSRKCSSGSAMQPVNEEVASASSVESAVTYSESQCEMETLPSKDEDSDKLSVSEKDSLSEENPPERETQPELIELSSESSEDYDLRSRLKRRKIDEVSSSTKDSTAMKSTETFPEVLKSEQSPKDRVESSESSNTSKSLNEPGFQSIYEDITPASSVHSVSSKKDSNDDQSSKGSNCSRSSVRDEVLSKSFRRTSVSDRSPSESATESVYEDVTYLSRKFSSGSSMQPINEEDASASSVESVVTYSESQCEMETLTSKDEDSDKLSVSEKDSSSEENPPERETQPELIELSSESSVDYDLRSRLKRRKIDEVSSSTKDSTAMKSTETFPEVLKSEQNPKDRVESSESEASYQYEPGEYYLVTPPKRFKRDEDQDSPDDTEMELDIN